MNLENSAYLDIETSWQRKTTVIGIFRPGDGTTQLVRERDGVFRVVQPHCRRAHHERPELLAEAMATLFEGVDTLFTYNGACFDLPVVAAEFGVHLKKLVPHRDLLWDCRKKKLKGGLKGVERTLGIHRDTEGVNGITAMNLWSTWREKEEREALDYLLHYNREDCENLYILARKLGVGAASLVIAPDADTEAAGLVITGQSQTTSVSVPVSVSIETMTEQNSDVPPAGSPCVDTYL